MRKGFEAWFTVLIELLWPKRRIMEVYLNIAETGIGTYGAEAGARRYFRHSAVRLTPTEGIRHVAQDTASLHRVGQLYADMPAYALAALGIAVPAMGSAVLGLALDAGALPAEDAYRVSSLDELFQREQWGEDTEATARLAQVQADILLAERFLQLSRAD